MLTEQQKADGWIEHGGGGYPDPCPARAQIWCRGEFWTTVQKSATIHPDEYAEQWHSGAIIAYRPVQP